VTALFLPCLPTKGLENRLGGSQLCCSSARGYSFSLRPEVVPKRPGQAPETIARLFNAKSSGTTGFHPAQRMIPVSGNRFSEKIMRKQKMHET
jgi:hypothetical protein